MDIRAIAFDVNGTLIDIVTEDSMEASFRAVGHFLTYQGISLRRGELRDLYFQTLKQQKASSPEQYPEFNAAEIWRTIIDDHSSGFTHNLSWDKRVQLPIVAAEIYRGMTRRQLRLYPYVREVLKELRTRFPLAIVSDAQSTYARGELYQTGIADFFDPIIISGDHGFRKPDARLFHYALQGMGVAAENTLYVGNDMYRDVWGAREVGMPTVMFDSNQGTKEHKGCIPDVTITDFRELLNIVG